MWKGVGARWSWPIKHTWLVSGFTALYQFVNVMWRRLAYGRSVMSKSHELFFGYFMRGYLIPEPGYPNRFFVVLLCIRQILEQ